MIIQIIFFANALLMILASIMMIVTRHPVRAALFLILNFFCAAILWMLCQAEFLSLALIFVYVGAVMTLFLFVVMMLNIDLEPLKEGFVKYLPFGLIVMVLFAGMLILAFSHQHFALAGEHIANQAAGYNNVKVMGYALYTTYVYPFEIAAVILLVAIVAAISLAFHGRKPGTKSQDISAQHSATKAARLKIVNIEAKKP